MSDLYMVIVLISLTVGFAWLWYPKLRDIFTDDPALRRREAAALNREKAVLERLYRLQSDFDDEVNRVAHEKALEEKQRFIDHLSAAEYMPSRSLEDQLNDMHETGNLHA